jgi:hypothetical protein
MPTWEGTIPETDFAPLAGYVRQLGLKSLAAARNVATTETGK